MLKGVTLLSIEAQICHKKPTLYHEVLYSIKMNSLMCWQIGELKTLDTSIVGCYPFSFPLCQLCTNLRAMIQSRDLGRRLGGHCPTSVAASRYGLGRYAQNATNKAQKILKKSRQILKNVDINFYISHVQNKFVLRGN